MTIVPEIKATLAQKLDDSDHVVNYWRDGWHLITVKIGVYASIGAYIMAILQAEAAVYPLFGIPWLQQWELWCVVGLVATCAVLSRFYKQTKKHEPPDDTDSMGDAGPLK